MKTPVVRPKFVAGNIQHRSGDELALDAGVRKIGLRILIRRSLVFRTTCLVALCLVAAAHLLFPALSAAAREVPRLVILNSYHPGFAWSDGEMQGLVERIHEVHPGIELPIEFLDAKRRPGRKHMVRVKDFLLEKYRGRKIDVVVCLDNPALTMALRFRDELFPGVPLVFAGVSDFCLELANGHRNVTGVAERMDVGGTLEAALALHPRTTRVYVVNDETLSGRAARREAEPVARSLPGRVEVRFLPAGTFDELVAEMGSLPPDSLASILSFATDTVVESRSLADSTRLLTSAARVPSTAFTKRGWVMELSAAGS